MGTLGQSLVSLSCLAWRDNTWALLTYGISITKGTEKRCEYLLTFCHRRNLLTKPKPSMTTLGRQMKSYHLPRIPFSRSTTPPTQTGHLLV